jgi:hypothetical protein
MRFLQYEGLKENIRQAQELTSGNPSSPARFYIDNYPHNPATG